MDVAFRSSGSEDPRRAPAGSSGPAPAAVQAPASGPNVVAAIAQALGVAEALRDRMRRLDRSECDDCRLWLELLAQYRDQLLDDKVPEIRRGDLAAPVGIVLTGRRWRSFQRWFVRNMLSLLQQASKRSGVPLLYGGRSSNRRGGWPEISEAQYFVSFEAPVPEVSAEVAMLEARGSRVEAGETQPARNQPSAATFEAMSVVAAQMPSHDRNAKTLSAASSTGSDQCIRTLRESNARLKRLLAERDLEIDVLKEMWQQ